MTGCSPYYYLPSNPSCTSTPCVSPCSCVDPCSTNTYISSNYIIYSGPPLSCLDVENGDTLSDILQGLNETICEIQLALGLVTTTTTSTSTSTTTTTVWPPVTTTSTTSTSTSTTTSTTTLYSIPVITLIGAATITLTTGESYVEYGATAYDSIDGDITDDLVITGSVSTEVEGTYYIYYNVTNSLGVPAVEVIRTIIVISSATILATLYSKAYYENETNYSPVYLTQARSYLEAELISLGVVTNGGYAGLSSMTITPGYSATLYANGDLTGSSVSVTSNAFFLGQSPWYFNDKTKSLTIQTYP